MNIALITIAAILIVYGAVSKPLDARGVTSAMVFTAAGVIVGTSLLDLVSVEIETATAERFCELALVLLLFSDATRIDLAGLRGHLGWPSRLLLIGLPLTILTGVGAGLLVFPGIALASAFVTCAALRSVPSPFAPGVVHASGPLRYQDAIEVDAHKPATPIVGSVTGRRMRRRSTLVAPCHVET